MQMAYVGINNALHKVQKLKQQQPELRRLDTPTEAALVAVMANRQLGEVVISSIGDPQPKPDYCFAHLAPPCIRGADKFRHAYVLGQHGSFGCYELAHQKGLLRTPRQLKEQQQKSPLSSQHRSEPAPIPCSPAAASAPDCHAADDQHTPCRTPLSQLRADHQQQLEDSSPCNNLVRQLAADINARSPALRVTLEQYSSLTRNSPSSFHMRVSNRSESSQDGRSTPIASPGRSWASQPPAADLALEDLTFDLQDSGAAQPRAPWSEDSAGSCTAEAQQSPAASPHARSSRSGELGIQEQLKVLACDADLRSRSPRSMASEQDYMQDILRPAQDLSAVAVPSLQFKGFGTQLQQQAAIKSTGSIQLDTPRLQPPRTLMSSNCSSSNGTVICSDAQPFGSRGGSWGAAGMQHNAADMSGSHSTANWAANQHENELVAAGGNLMPAGAGIVSIDSAGAGSGLPSASSGTKPGDVQTEGAGPTSSTAGLAASVAGISTAAAAGMKRFAEVQQAWTDNGATTDSAPSSAELGSIQQDDRRVGAAQGVTQQDSPAGSPAQGATEQDDHGSNGYWSCDEEESAEDFTAQPAVEDAKATSAQQTLGAPCTPAAAGVWSAAASAGGDDACQLSPLTSQSLAQLTQSFTEAGEPDPPHPADDDATTCCDWATVYSYEEFD